MRGNFRKNQQECPQMFTGPVGPIEVFGDFYWPGVRGSLLASSPASSN